MGRAIAAGAVLVWLVALAAAAASPQPEEVAAAASPQPEEGAAAVSPQPEKVAAAASPQPEEGAAAVSPQPEEGVAAEENRAAAEDQPLVLPRTHLLGTHAHETHAHGTHSHGTHALDDRLDLLEYKLLTLAARCPETFCAPAEKRPRACRPLRGCQRSPSPLPADQAPHQQPAALACACSCLQLQQQGGSPESGVYWFTGMPVPVMCDFSHDGGGWTLLLTAVSRSGWDLLSVLQRSEHSPSLVDNYSILRYGDRVRDLGTGGRFAYRIEAQAEVGRQRWGGVWFAPRQYSFVDETGDQTEIRLVRKFDSWEYKDNGIEKRMPWLRDIDDFTVLTTTGKEASVRWGTLVLNKAQTDVDWEHSPWIDGDARHSGTVLYWMREEEL